MTKPEWRRHLRQLLEQTKIDAHEAVNAHLDEYLKTQTGIWAGFSAMGHEPLLNLKSFTSNHMTWVFPVVEGDRLCWFTKGPKGMQKGAFGILEPVTDGAIEHKVTEFSGVLVPALGFDQKGTRLGWGKGFYDKAFADARRLKKLKMVGVAWSTQIVDELPAEDHDMQVQVVITEKGIQKIAED